VELNGVTYTAKIATQLSEDFLILLRHMLLQHWGEALEAVENVDVGFNHLKFSGVRSCNHTTPFFRAASP